MEIQPVEGYIVLKEITKQEELSKSGLIIPESADLEVTDRAKVVRSNKYTEGGTVFIKKHMYDEVELEKQTYLLGPEDGVIGILKDA